MNKKRLLLVLLILAAGFFSGCGHRVMDMDDFYAYEVGMSAAELERKAGKPDVIRDLGDNTQEYEYIERVSFDMRFAEVRHYLFTIKNGNVVAKSVKQDTLPPRVPNSYDMQTSENQDKKAEPTPD